MKALRIVWRIIATAEIVGIETAFVKEAVRYAPVRPWVTVLDIVGAAFLFAVQVAMSSQIIRLIKDEEV